VSDVASHATPNAADALTAPPPRWATGREIERHYGIGWRVRTLLCAEHDVAVVRPGTRWDYVDAAEFDAAWHAHRRLVEAPPPLPPRPGDQLAEKVARVRVKRAERAAKAAAPKTVRRTRGASKTRTARRAESNGPP